MLDSCHFWNKKSIFLETLHHSSVSWDITPLYHFNWNYIYFTQKEPVYVQIWWNFTWAVKSLKFWTLFCSFCKNHIKFQLKKHGKLISHDMETLWLVVSNMIWGIWWIFAEPLKSLKISLWWTTFVQNIWGLS